MTIRCTTSHVHRDSAHFHLVWSSHFCPPCFSHRPQPRTSVTQCFQCSSQPTRPFRQRRRPQRPWLGRRMVKSCPLLRYVIRGLRRAYLSQPRLLLSSKLGPVHGSLARAILLACCYDTIFCLRACCTVYWRRFLLLCGPFLIHWPSDADVIFCPHCEHWPSV